MHKTLSISALIFPLKILLLLAWHTQKRLALLGPQLCIALIFTCPESCASFLSNLCWGFILPQPHHHLTWSQSDGWLPCSTPLWFPFWHGTPSHVCWWFIFPFSEVPVGIFKDFLHGVYTAFKLEQSFGSSALSSCKYKSAVSYVLYCLLRGLLFLSSAYTQRFHFSTVEFIRL